MKRRDFIAGLFALEDAVHVGGGASVLVEKVRRVGQKAAVHDEVSECIEGRQAVAARQREDQLAAIRDRNTGGDDESGIRRA